MEGSVYYVTFRVASGELDKCERKIVLDHLRSGSGKFYALPAVVVMPDHVHLLIKPLPSFSLSRILKGIKGVSAHLVNVSRGTSGQVWLDESYDRIVRDYAEFLEKLQYMADYPVKAGLVALLEEYDAWYCESDTL